MRKSAVFYTVIAIFVSTISFSCSDSNDAGEAGDIDHAAGNPDKTTSDGDSVRRDEFNFPDEEDKDEAETPDGESNNPDEDQPSGFTLDFDKSTKTCVDTTDGKIILATAMRRENNRSVDGRIFLFILKDNGTIEYTGKHFPIDPQPRGIGFNANGKLAAVSSWETGSIDLIAVSDNSVCLVEKDIFLPNRKVQPDDNYERVIFQKIVADPNDPYKIYLVSGNPLENSNLNYGGGVYSLLVNSSAKAEFLTDDHFAVHVPDTMAILPGGTHAIVPGAKTFTVPEGSNVGNQGPEDIAVVNLSGDIPEAVHWEDLWLGSLSSESVGISDNGYVLMANSMMNAEDTGSAKLFKVKDDYSLENIDMIDNMEEPSYVAMNRAGNSALIAGLFEITVIKIENDKLSKVSVIDDQQLVDPMILIKSAPFEDHVLVHGFRSPQSESTSISLLKIGANGDVELISSLPVEIEEGWRIENLAVQ